ncbi:MAG TPA: RNA methyltransferase [Solirubrobacteraceae bacterium]|jgi:TrmH family RNA methyltransferase|nr:RNA methyltransferase [Solirubrobacteraceae bacterium]
MTATIASPQNARLKAVRRLHGKRERERRQAFVAEGEDLLAAAQRAGRAPVEGYRLAGTGLGGEDFTDVARPALAAASTLGSGTRVIAVHAQRWSAAAGPLCVYLHGVADPGNVGTILRSAEAFGASCVALGPGCADPHSPKAVRASTGAIFSVPLARVRATGELPGVLVALDAHAGEDIEAVCGALQGPVTVLVGAEREGLPPDVAQQAARVARIPIASESLNAAMAATVALYEFARGHNRSSRVRAS